MFIEQARENNFADANDVVGRKKANIADEFGRTKLFLGSYIVWIHHLNYNQLVLIVKLVAGWFSKKCVYANFIYVVGDLKVAT